MGARNRFNMDVRGMLDVDAQLAMLSLPPKLRRRLLNRVGLRIRTQWRKRVREQRDLNGSAFAPRKQRRKGQKAKMLTGLATHIGVTRLTDKEAELGWGKRKTAIIAGVHNAGMTQRRTAAQMQSWSRNTPLMATAEQAKRLRRLGYKVRQPGKTKRGNSRWLRPSVEWITDNIKYQQAGLLIRLLKQEKPGPQAWEIELPKREFFGVASQQEVSELVAHLLPQILNSPR